jgi:hypothetical protein
MSLFVSRPAIPIDRDQAAVRTLWFWPALLASVALLLDAFSPLMPSAGARGFLWLDLAAAFALFVALAASRTHDGKAWATPFDGRVLAGFILAILQVVATRGADLEVLWLRQIASSGVCFYAIASLLRREPLAGDAVWPAFAVLVLGLSFATLGALTQGTAAVVALSQRVDAAWVSEHGIGKVLLLGTVLVAGRASEPGARALWRVTAIVGALATLVHWGIVGTGMALASLSSLDEPFYFGTGIVAVLTMAGIARLAWGLVRERPEEAARWRATAVTFVLVILLLVFGGTTGGEGVRLMAALAAAGAIAAHLAPAKAVVRTPLASEPPVARAA